MKVAWFENEYLRGFLSRHGVTLDLEVVQYRTRDDVALLQPSQYDLIVVAASLDYIGGNKPQDVIENALEMISQIRAMEPYKEVPIIVKGTELQNGVATKFTQAGATALVPLEDQLSVFDHIQQRYL